MANQYNLTMDSVLQFSFKHGKETHAIRDIFVPENNSEEEFIEACNAWIQTGRARIITPHDPAAEIADKIAKEIMAIEAGKTFEEDRNARANYDQGSHGYYEKVGFPAKTLLHAQELHQQLIRNFNISPAQLGVEMNNGAILIIINNCPVKTFIAIDRVFAVQKVTGVVTGGVDKAAGTLVNATDITINSLAVPVAKTAIGTTAKVGKSIVGLAAKLGGILVGEVVKNTKQCCTEIANDGYIAEARGEVVDGVHTIRRAIISKSNSSSFSGGQILN